MPNSRSLLCAASSTESEPVRHPTTRRHRTTGSTLRWSRQSALCFLDRLKFESKNSKSTHSSSMEASTGRYHSCCFLRRPACSLERSLELVCVCVCVVAFIIVRNCLTFFDLKTVKIWWRVCVQGSSARLPPPRPSRTTPSSGTSWSTWASVSHRVNCFHKPLLKDFKFKRLAVFSPLPCSDQKEAVWNSPDVLGKD